MNFNLVKLDILTGNETVWYEVEFSKEMILEDFVKEVTTISIEQNNNGSFIMDDINNNAFMLYDKGKNILLDRYFWKSAKKEVISSARGNKDRLNNINYVIHLKEEENNNE